MTVGKTWDLDMAAGPIYRQIAQHVRRALACGVIKSGDRLPSVRELAQQLKVNQNTVVHAYSQLEREGIVETRRGLGTFIRDGIPVAVSQRELLIAAAQRYAREVLALSVSPGEAIEIVREVLDAGDVG
jgi:GntR family transcriptional regulator